MFGLSFGTSKEKTNQTQTIDQLVNGTQATDSKQNQTSTGTSKTQSSGTSTTGVSNDQTQNTTGKQTQTGQTQNFDAKTLEALGGNVGDFISKILGSSAASPDAATKALGGFDPEKFINDTMAAATSTIGDQASQATRGVTSLIGGNSHENSMSALLDSKIQNEAAANLAGVDAKAQADAQGILAQRAGVISNAGANSSNALAQVLNAIKGGTQTTTADTTNAQSQGTTGTQTSSTATSESSSTQQTQQLIDIVNSLVNSNQHTTGTTNVNGTTSKSGGGFSLGL